MTTTETHRPTPMTADQLLEMLKLSESADSVELKLTIPDADRRATVKALEIDPLGARLRQIVFFDTPDLALNHHGVVVRARRTQGKGDDSVVKLRPVVPTELPSKLRKADDFKVEVDAMPGGFVCSGSYKGTLGPDAVKPVLAGQRPISTLFSKQQRAFFADHAPAGIDAGRPRGARTDRDDEAEVPPDGVQPADRRGAVALPRRFAHRGALHQVHPARRPSTWPPSRRRSSRRGA